MLRNSVAVAVVRTRPRAIPLAMITMRKSTHGFSFVSHMCMGLRQQPFGPPELCYYMFIFRKQYLVSVGHDCAFLEDWSVWTNVCAPGDRTSCLTGSTNVRNLRVLLHNNQINLKDMIL